MIICPACKKTLETADQGLKCSCCGYLYKMNDGVYEFGMSAGSEDSFPERSLDRLYKIEETHFWHKTRKALIRDMLKRYLRPGAKMLEVGCGNGNVAAFLKKSGWLVDCGDIYVSGLIHCKERCGSGKYFQFSLDQEIFAEEYDCVGAFDVLEHLEDDSGALRNIYMSLKAGGLAVITVPAASYLWSKSDEYAGHKRRYSCKELEAKLTGEGFRIVRSSYYMTLLLPVLVLFRYYNKLFRKNDDRMTSEIKTPRCLNSIFYTVFCSEVWLLKYIDLPFGNSLIYVAVKPQSRDTDS